MVNPRSAGNDFQAFQAFFCSVEAALKVLEWCNKGRFLRQGPCCQGNKSQNVLASKFNRRFIFLQLMVILSKQSFHLFKLAVKLSHKFVKYCTYSSIQSSENDSAGYHVSHARYHLGIPGRAVHPPNAAGRRRSFVAPER